MFIFDNSVERVLTRNKALGYKSFVIGDDVTSGCEADMSLDNENGCICINRATAVEATDEEPEITLVLKEFGVFSNIQSEIEVTICDKYMVVTLIKGAIDVNLDGNVMMASRGVDVDKITCQSMDSVVWIDVETLLSFTQFWCGENKDYPYDYIYRIFVSGNNSGTRTLRMTPVKPNEFLLDISNGALEVINQKRMLKAEIDRVRNEAKMVLNPKNYEKTIVEDDDEFHFDASAYDDLDDDDDDISYDDYDDI